MITVFTAKTGMDRERVVTVLSLYTMKLLE